MDSFGYLLRKSKESIVEDGLTGYTRKVGRYIKQQFDKESTQKVKDILFINGCYLPHPSRYRVTHQREQLESNNFTTDEVFYEKLSVDLEKYYRGFVFYRCPITPEVKAFIEKAKYNNKTVFFDIDDLVFDTKYTDTIEYVQKMSKEDKKVYDDGVIRMGKTLDLCDYAITTTEGLRDELKKHVKEVYINRNTASERMLELSLKTTKRNDDKIIMGYLSGSITHNPDFEMIKPAIIKIMDEYPNTYLQLAGELDVPSDLAKFKDRIIKTPFVDYTKLPQIIANLDINLAPLEDGLFNRAKSENKWMEACLVKTVTIASDVGAFKVIDNKKTGLLVKNDIDSWYKGLKELIDNPKLREELANNGFERCKHDYVTTYSGLGLTSFIKSKLAPSIAFFLPTTNISGGVNVVIKHCNILRNNGYDVFIINMDKVSDNIVNKDGEIEVIAYPKTKVWCYVDNMVATLWSTMFAIKKYNKCRKISYLVQNFETDFIPYGNYQKQLANSTYTLDNVDYLTISKWCEDWLIKKYGRKVKYAPNGIKLEQFPYNKRTFDGKIRILIEGNSDDYYKNVDESFKIVEKLDKSKFEIKYLSYQGEPKKWYYVDEFLHKVPYDEVGKIYNSADILIKSSKLESFSYPPLEMMATGGIAVVAPNEGNVEYLRDGENCLLYGPGNIDEAVDKINSIVEDKKLREKLIKGGQDTAKSREWKNIEKEILKLYE
jgi:glycosyltransferase involved in cell wall biosynthesis